MREPATGEVLGLVGPADTGDVAAAVDRATTAQRDWVACPHGTADEAAALPTEGEYGLSLGITRDVVAVLRSPTGSRA